MIDRSVLVLEEIDVLLLERRELAGAGPHFKIIGRPRGELVGVYLVYRAREYQLLLSTSIAILFGFLARHRRIAQTASQIERGIRTDCMGLSSMRPKMRCHRTSVKTYIRRIRLALEWAFEEAGLALSTTSVLLSEITVGNQVGYRLRATVEWMQLTD